MSDAVFSGVLTAIATPFRSHDGAVDEAALRAIVEHQIAAGAAGIVPCGSTGEFFALSADERRQVVEWCADAAAGRVALVPQTGALSTLEAVALARHAERSGAAAVLAMPPYFSALSEGDVLRYYDALVAAVAIPVVYYHNPGVTGFAPPPERLVELCARVGIRHVKYTSPDVSGLTALLLDHAGAVQTLPAWDHLTLTAFLSGARCSIWGAAAAVPELCIELLDAAAAEDLERTLAAWRRAAPLFTALGSLGYVSAVKAAGMLLGLPLGAPRPPLGPLSPTGLDGLSQRLREAGYVLSTTTSAESTRHG